MSLPTGLTPPESLCQPDTPDCDAARIERLTREALVKDGWEPKLVDLLRTLGFSHCGPHAKSKDSHHWRMLLGPDYLHILLRPPGSLHDLPEALYLAGRRDLRREAATAYQTLHHLFASYEAPTFPTDKPTVEQRLAALEAQLKPKPEPSATDSGKPQIF